MLPTDGYACVYELKFKREYQYAYEEEVKIEFKTIQNLDVRVIGGFKREQAETLRLMTEG